MVVVFVILTFALIITGSYIVQKSKAKKATVPAIDAGKSISYGLKADDLALPADLFFHRGHTWAKLDASGKIKIGMDDFAQKVLGRLDRVKLLKIGDSVHKGDNIFTVKQGKREAVFNSPVDGVISEVNDDVSKNPALIKDNPYDKGWIYAITPSNLAANIKSLSVAEDAMKWIKLEVQRFEKFISEQFSEDKMLGKTLADGGIPVEGVMEHMNENSWFKMQEKFLTK